MKVVACLKRIPAPDGNIRLTDDGQRLDCSLVDSILNPPDEYALEAALRIRELDPSSHLLVLSAGGRASEHQLRMALAVGADDALLIESPDATSALAACLTAAVLQKQRPDLVFCGRQALDDQLGLFPAALAERLDYAHVSGVHSVDGSAGREGVVCRRRGDGGEQEISVSIPAVIACDRMAHELRVPTLKNRLAAKKRTIQVVSPTEADVQALLLERTRYQVPVERSPRRVWSSLSDATVAELLGVLRQEEGLER